MCVLAQMKMHRLLVGGEQQTTSIFMAQKKQKKNSRENITAICIHRFADGKTKTTEKKLH